MDILKLVERQDDDVVVIVADADLATLDLYVRTIASVSSAAAIPLGHDYLLSCSYKSSHSISEVVSNSAN